VDQAKAEPAVCFGIEANGKAATAVEDFDPHLSAWIAMATHQDLAGPAAVAGMLQRVGENLRGDLTERQNLFGTHDTPWREVLDDRGSAAKAPGEGRADLVQMLAKVDRTRRAVGDEDAMQPGQGGDLGANSVQQRMHRLLAGRLGLAVHVHGLVPHIAHQQRQVVGDPVIRLGE